METVNSTITEPHDTCDIAQSLCVTARMNSINMKIFMKSPHHHVYYVSCHLDYICQSLTHCKQTKLFIWYRVWMIEWLCMSILISFTMSSYIDTFKRMCLIKNIEMEWKKRVRWRRFRLIDRLNYCLIDLPVDRALHQSIDRSIDRRIAWLKALQNMLMPTIIACLELEFITHKFIGFFFAVILTWTKSMA